MDPAAVDVCQSSWRTFEHWPLVIGGVIGIVGSIATILAGHMLTQRAEKNEFKKKKLEELVALTAENAYPSRSG